MDIYIIKVEGVDQISKCLRFKTLNFNLITEKNFGEFK